MPVERQSSEASEVVREWPVEKGVVPMRGVSFGPRKTVANLTQKIHSGKRRNVGP